MEALIPVLLYLIFVLVIIVLVLWVFPLFSKPEPPQAPIQGVAVEKPQEKERKMFAVSAATPDEIREYVHTEAGQDEIVSFIDALRAEVGSREGYVATLAGAEKHAGSLDVNLLSTLLARFDPFIQLCPPGHDKGHIYRDLLGSMALAAADPYLGKASWSEVFAGILGGAFHDIGNSVTRRYEDTVRRAGHAEISAWLFDRVSADLLPEPVRKLAAYDKAAHTHYTKPIDVKNPEGYKRQMFWYEIWEEGGKPVGLSVLLARFADRLDTNGVTLFARHLLATADAVEGGGGKDFSGKEFFELNEEALHTMLLPQVRDGNPKPPTVLEHMGNFAASNFHASIYSRDDHMFPVMTKLMLTKVFQTTQFTRIVAKQSPQMADFSAPFARAQVKDTLRQISAAPGFERSWDVLQRAWEALSAEDQARWQAGFAFVRSAYLDWLEELVGYASRRQEFASFARELAGRCT